MLIEHLIICPLEPCCHLSGMVMTISVTPFCVSLSWLQLTMSFCFQPTIFWLQLLFLLPSVSQLYFCVIFSYAVLLIEKNDEEGQAQVLSAALEVLSFIPIKEKSKSSCLNVIWCSVRLCIFCLLSSWRLQKKKILKLIPDSGLWLPLDH